MEDSLKLFPVWSNFIYFIAGIYALIVSYRKSIWFGVFGVLILLTGIFSIVYHVNTPSWTGEIQTTKSDEYHKWLKVDQSFAIILLIYSILFFVSRIIQLRLNLKTKMLKFVTNNNFLLAILFLILSIIFYCMSHRHIVDASGCNATASHGKQFCIHGNLDAYDIFHSNWHIFTSIGLIFWISLMNDSYRF